MNDNGNQQYETISKFDRAYGGLVGGNNLKTNPSTIKEVNNITGEAETFIIQTIRAEQRKKIVKGLEETIEITVGSFVVIEYLSKDGHQRLILPPKVAATIARQDSALSDKARSNAAKAQAKERKLRGELPGFMRKKTQEVLK